MKLFKIIFLSILVIGIITFTIIKFYPSIITPKSDQNDFYDKLNNAFKTSQLDPINLTIRDYLNEIDFYLQDEDNNLVKVIISTQKDPYWQIVSLQDFSKTAKMNHKQFTLVDLSIDHPYATFKNN
ncbi:hypothetical protein SDC9_136439 [bioreactor metagenome]|uniref:Uncharacterized protein n=1 Tax=bioreactor metagenome TaxID=1076179 RepID=A0A645DIM7_9ZZZZ